MRRFNFLIAIGFTAMTLAWSGCTADPSKKAEPVPLEEPQEEAAPQQPSQVLNPPSSPGDNTLSNQHNTGDDANGTNGTGDAEGKKNGDGKKNNNNNKNINKNNNLPDPTDKDPPILPTAVTNAADVTPIVNANFVFADHEAHLPAGDPAAGGKLTAIPANSVLAASVTWNVAGTPRRFDLDSTSLR